MVFSKKSRHEKIDVEAYHVFFCIAEEIGYGLSYLFYPTSLLDKIYVYNPLLFQEIFSFSFLNEPFFENLLPS